MMLVRFLAPWSRNRLLAVAVSFIPMDVEVVVEYKITKKLLQDVSADAELIFND